MVTKVVYLTIDADDDGQRLDNFLFRQLKDVPKTRIYRALRHGEVRINKKRVKANSRLQAGDELRIPPLYMEEKVEKTPPTYHWQAAVEQAILYEDEQLIVVNKPSGLAVHGGSGLDYGLIEVMRQLRPDCKRLELAHRLDKETSGCNIICKKAQALRQIHQQLREKTLHKSYLALVRGHWPKRKTSVSVPLNKNSSPNAGCVVKPDADGKESLTRFAIRESFAEATLIEAMPATGRTHQIRVHAQYAGFALLGDEKYSRPDDLQWAKYRGLKRLFLHASAIDFSLNDKRLHIEAPLPDDLQQVLNGLRQR